PQKQKLAPPRFCGRRALAANAGASLPAKPKHRAEVGPPTKAKARTAPLLWEARPRGECRRQPASKAKASRRGRPSHKAKPSPHRLCGRRAPAANAGASLLAKPKHRAEVGPPTKAKARTAPLLWEARPRGECRR